MSLIKMGAVATLFSCVVTSSEAQQIAGETRLPTLTTDVAHLAGRFSHAERLFSSGDYAGAVQAIEREIGRAPLAPEEGFVYETLAVAAFGAEQNDKAYAAVVRAIGSDPASRPAWITLHKLRSTPASWEALELPDGMKDDRDLLLILRCDQYQKWPRFIVRGCATAYESYAHRLTVTGRSRDANRVRAVTSAAVVEHAAHAYFERYDPDEAEALLDFLGTLEAFSTAEPAVQSSAYTILAFIDQRQRRYLHAIEDYGHLVKIGHGGMAELLWKRMERLFRDVSSSISWDPETGMLRTPDEADFFDIIGFPEELPTNVKGKRIPYGMTSPDEDSATLVSALFADELRNVVPNPAKASKLVPIETTIQERLIARNFELPVKVLLEEVSIFTTGEEPSAETVKSIDAKIAKIEAAMQAADDVPDPTLTAFEVAKRGWKILLERRFSVPDQE